MCLNLKVLEVIGLGFDIVGLAILLLPDFRFAESTLRRFPAVRRLHAMIDDTAEQCRVRGFGPPVPNVITFQPSIKLQALTKDQAKQLLRLYPGSKRPTSLEGIAPWLMGEVPIEHRGTVQYDPLMVLCDDEGETIFSSPFRVSQLIQHEEEIVRRHAYTYGFVLMFIATILQGIAALLR